MIKQLLLVGLGGGVGSMLRYLISLRVCPQSVFPFATFAVNISGCFLIGLFVGLLERYSIFGNDTRLLLVVGFCGGYTTFSTFSAENIKLLQSGNVLTAVAYTLLSVGLGVLALWGGNELAEI